MFDHTWLELIAIVCSRTSVFGWIAAGMYQLYLGMQSPDNIGFSPLFLAGYVIGDACDLLGCFWSEQLGFQKIIAAASLVTDSLMALQFYYYHTQRRITFSGRRPSTALVTCAMFGISHALQIEGLHHMAPVPQEPEMDYKFLTGQILAWSAQIFYVSGVVPQVYQNYCLKCTGGISQFLFVADLVGSIGYVATICATAQTIVDPKESVEFLFDELAYLLGTSVTLILDLVLLVQYKLYPDTVEVLAGVPEVEEVDEQTPLKK